MRTLIFLICTVFFTSELLGQINIIPYVGMNSTRMNYKGDYEKGGSFGLVGLDLEFKLSKRNKELYLSFASGASYLKNGFYRSNSFSFTAIGAYTSDITDLKMEYFQIPVMVRLNWQPFPLVEDWKVFFGAGICSNFLLQSHLYEKHTEIYYTSGFQAPPETTTYQDQRDITELGKKQSYFRRFEIGMNYKRLQVTFRISKSITDMYHEGLENTWGVPDEDSGYISTHQTEGKTTEKYSELVLGFRIGK